MSIRSIVLSEAQHLEGAKMLGFYRSSPWLFLNVRM